MKESLPAVSSLVAVCAHPDDESFGLGAILGAFADAGTRCSVLCFTSGEASTLGADEGDLAEIRPRELAEAAEVLGVSAVELLDYPDGGLAERPLEDLTAHAVRVAAEVGSRMFLVFDEGGITGHPDHVRATEAALAAADAIGGRVLAWAIPDRVARALNAEFGATFVGRSEDDRHRDPGWTELVSAGPWSATAARRSTHPCRGVASSSPARWSGCGSSAGEAGKED